MQTEHRGDLLEVRRAVSGYLSHRQTLLRALSLVWVPQVSSPARPMRELYWRIPSDRELKFEVILSSQDIKVTGLDTSQIWE